MKSDDIKQIDEKYDVVKKLGAGGMGAVFEAKHRGTGRRVAIKLILADGGLDDAMIMRFQREALAAGAIDSEHITEVLDSGTDRETGTPYLVMELLSGEDVEHIQKRLRPMRPDLALKIVSQALRGLERAHDAGVVHRDIKPANLFLSSKSGSLTVKVCDFGIAKVSEDTLTASQNIGLTQTSALLGSPRYMSPEQAKGSKSLDARADLWSLGIVLFQLLAGDTPHGSADTLGLLLLAICSAPAKSVQEAAPWVSKEIAAIVKRALMLEASDRYPNAKAMREDIAKLLPDGDVIDESTLVALTDEERNMIAERDSALENKLDRTLGDSPAAKKNQEEILTLAEKQADVVEDSRTGSAFTQSHAGVTTQPKSTRTRTLAAIVAVASASLVGAVFATLKNREEPAKTAPSVASPLHEVPSETPIEVASTITPKAIASEQATATIASAHPLPIVRPHPPPSASTSLSRSPSPPPAPHASSPAPSASPSSHLSREFN